MHRMVKRAVEMEGTVTGEHGVGLIKRDYLAHELGESTVDAMRQVSSTFHFLIHPSTFLSVPPPSLFRNVTPSLFQIQIANPVYSPNNQLKRAFDPLCLLNCDKIVRVQTPAKSEVKAW